MTVAMAVLLQVGGVSAPAGVVESAVACLESAPGIMVRQPLTRAGNVLAMADYHRVAAPYRDMFTSTRARTKSAFIHALTILLEEYRAVTPFERFLPLLDEAYSAIGSDAIYAAAIARAATSVIQKRHTWRLRLEVREAASRAVRQCSAHTGEFTCVVASPCGTGDCKFAQGEMALIEVASTRGRMSRPPNYQGPPTFSSEDGVRSLEQLKPCTIR